MELLREVADWCYSWGFIECIYCFVTYWTCCHFITNILLYVATVCAIVMYIIENNYNLFKPPRGKSNALWMFSADIFNEHSPTQWIFQKFIYYLVTHWVCYQLTTNVLHYVVEVHCLYTINTQFCNTDWRGLRSGATICWRWRARRPLARPPTGVIYLI